MPNQITLILSVKRDSLPVFRRTLAADALSASECVLERLGFDDRPCQFVDDALSGRTKPVVR